MTIPYKNTLNSTHIPSHAYTNTDLWKNTWELRFIKPPNCKKSPCNRSPWKLWSVVFPGTHIVSLKAQHNVKSLTYTCVLYNLHATHSIHKYVISPHVSHHTHTHIHLDMDTCTHIHMRAHTHTHTHKHTHTHTNKQHTHIHVACPTGTNLFFTA